MDTPGTGNGKRPESTDKIHSGSTPRSVRATVICSGIPGAPCGRVIAVGSLDGPVSHGLCEPCYHVTRAALGLKPKAFPRAA